MGMLMIILYSLIVLSILSIVFLSYMGKRNQWVFEVRGNILKRFGEEEKVTNYKGYNEISYEKMLWQVFKSKKTMQKEMEDRVFKTGKEKLQDMDIILKVGEEKWNK